MGVKAVVLGRNYIARLGMIRAVGMAGYEVHVIKTDPYKKSEKKKDRIDGSSKYITAYYCMRESDDEIVSFILQRFGNSSDPVILIPTDDYNASVIDSHLDQFGPPFLYPHIGKMQGEVIRHMDKGLQKQLALASGLNVAAGWTCTFDGERYTIPADVAFPCFIKPQIGYRGTKKMMAKCDSMAELRAVLDEVGSEKSGEKRGCDILVEEYIEIEHEFDVPGLANGSQVVLPGVIEKGIMHLGVTGSGTVKSFEKYGDVQKCLQDFIGKLGFIGLVDVELYESRGKMYFNELNMRFSASGYALTGMGVNLPARLIELLLSDGSRSAEEETISEEKSFASEKPCFQEYAVGKLSWEELWKTINSADFSFLKLDKDPEPFRNFKRMAEFRRMASRVSKPLKKILSRMRG